MAPKMPVKPNKVHSKPQEKKVDTSQSRKQSSSGSASSFTLDDPAKPIFDVSQAYRSSLPPLRVSKRLLEEKRQLMMNHPTTTTTTTLDKQQLRKKKFLLDEIEPSSVSIVRHSYHEEMRPAATTTVDECQRATAAKSRHQIRSDENKSQRPPSSSRNVVSSFDIYQNFSLATQSRPVKNLLENSDFV